MNGKQALEHLLAVMDCANDSPSDLNSSFNKKQVWNMMFSAVKDVAENDTVNNLIAGNILKEFPDYMRCDFVVEEAPRGNEQPIKSVKFEECDTLPF